MNTPLPTSDHATSSSAGLVGTSSTSTPGRDPSVTGGGVAFGQILSDVRGAGKTATAATHGAAPDKMSAATAPAANVPAGALSAIVVAAHDASGYPDPAAAGDPVSIPLPATAAAPDAGLMTKGSAVFNQDLAPVTPSPAQAAPSGKAAGKIKTTDAKADGQSDLAATPSQTAGTQAVGIQDQYAQAAVMVGAVHPAAVPVALPPAVPGGVAAGHGQVAASANSAEALPGAAAVAAAASSSPAEIAFADPLSVLGGPSAIPAAAFHAATASAADITATTALLGSAGGPASATVPSGTSTASSPAPASGSPSSRPAAQLAPALIQLGQAGGSNHITIRLDPVELGSVAIRIDRGDDGAASVQVTVERPETLRLLMSDQPELQRALDAAGLGQEGRSVTVSLATPEPSGAGGSSTSFSDGGSNSANPGGGGGNSGFSGQPENRSGQRQARPGPLANTLDQSSGWLRAGVDITA